jgi:hypothetical protein
MTARLGGWWRLWIVVSACYGLVVILFTGWHWPTAWSVSQASVVGRLPFAVAATIRSMPYRHDDVDLELPSGRSVKVGATTSVGDRDRLSREYSAAEAAEVHDERVSVGLGALALWFIGCALLLVIGAASGWVYRGFKRRRDGA